MTDCSQGTVRLHACDPLHARSTFIRREDGWNDLTWGFCSPARSDNQAAIQAAAASCCHCSLVVVVLLFLSESGPGQVVRSGQFR